MGAPVSVLETAIGALGGGLVALLGTAIKARTSDRQDERHAHVELARVQHAREETGAHATEKAIDATERVLARVEGLLAEERETRRRESEQCREEIRKLREDNTEIRKQLAEEKRRSCRLSSEVAELKERLRHISEPPEPIRPTIEDIKV